MPEPHRISTHDELRQLYREPSELVIRKSQSQMDEATQEFVRRSRFVLLATHGGDGSTDVSPRGGEQGFIRVLDAGHLAIADLGGNNRLDSLRNIVATGKVGLLFVHPGRGENVRLNGDAHLTTDPELLDSFTLARRPKTAIVIEVSTTFIHCAKAYIRSELWDPTSWSAYADAPDACDIITTQGVVDIDPAAMRAGLQADYEADLAAER